ncbi:MAG: hypothetical protein SFV15_12895 [Polyangiaceae bacterium]|nr:hypothetical protein [Polyangiaceae bacterium]
MVPPSDDDSRSPQSFDDASSDLPAPITLIDVPDHVAELCGSCVQYVWRSLKVPLDFTPETLPLLDHYIAGVRGELSAKPELGPLLARVVGAYFGEVVRKAHFGMWRASAPNVHDWQLCLRSVFLWFNPIGVAYDALFNTTEHDGPRSHLRVAPEDREALDFRLSEAPPVPEAEFYLLTTRLEALEIAVEALRLRMSARGYADVEFSENDYAAEFGHGLN